MRFTYLLLFSALLGTGLALVSSFGIFYTNYTPQVTTFNYVTIQQDFGCQQSNASQTQGGGSCTANLPNNNIFTTLATFGDWIDSFAYYLALIPTALYGAVNLLANVFGVPAGLVAMFAIGGTILMVNMFLLIVGNRNTES